MNREIKLKFWLGHTKKMTHWHNLKEVSDIIPEFTDDIIPLQYTGVKDRFRMEIFEGDIIEEDGFMGQVFYSDDSAGFYVSDGDCISLMDFDGACFVIGNIFENPELLKP